MSSNMLAGERRWASARKGGMTVLGKVAVPKPLNLPSQRLENHGLDPSVEIVPKGTLGWGSRPSSSGSNAWVSSSQSPNADGGNTLPIHLSGRPSSGGNVTRPSTAGSDRTHEPVASAWGSNSRPSSASGPLASNHSSSTSLRPRSAETRPNSSQLSRFAEPVSETSVAWGPSSAAERLGVKSSKGDGFSLSSGDFPTLGSEKDNITKNFESEEHTRPSSASGRVTPSKEDTRYHADSKSGVVNIWGPDGSQMEDDSFHPNMEKWPGEPPQYFNPNIPPQHFDAWRGPPANALAGGWYRGQPRGPTFGAPGGFPMEPFPYYRPQVPPLGGPRGPHQKNGEFYHGPSGPPHHGPPGLPHHDPPGPPHHGPPGPPHHGPPGPPHHGPPGPPHHGPPGPPHHGPPGPPHMPESYARPGMPFRPGFYRGPPGPPGSMAFEGYYGPPTGYHNNERDIPYMGMPAGPPVYNCYPGPNGPPDTGISHGKAGGRAISGKTMPEHMEADHLKNDKEWDRKVEGENWEHSVQPRRNNEWGDDDDDDDDDDGAERERSAMKRTTSENSSRNLSYGDCYSDSIDLKSFGGMHNVNKSGNIATFPPQMPLLPVATKDPDLMQKIEGLNAKIRATDGRKDARSAYSNNTGEVVHVPNEVIGQAGENQTPPTVVDPRSSHHGGQGRVEHHGKGKFNNQYNDGWRRKPLTPEFFGATKASNMESAHGPSFVGEAAEELLVSTVAKVEGGESVAEAYDSTDIQAQRAKMRELAKQRALQLQKEEEERIREQKAKALAKLEELNRRTQTGEAVTEEAEKFTGDVQREEQELCAADDINVVDRESVKTKSGKPDEVSENLRPDAPQTGAFEFNASRGLTSPIKENSCGDDRKDAVRSNDVGRSMPKWTGYKQKQQKSFIEKSFPISASEVHKSDTGILDADIKSMEAPSNEPGPNIESNVHDSPKTGPSTTTVNQRKKVNKSGKNKHKADDTRTVPALPPVTSDTNPENKPIEPEGTKASEESENKSTNYWKPQPVHRMQRSHQAKRFTDKAHGSEGIWAPVRTTHNNAEDTVEKSMVESTDLIKNDNAAHNNSLKGKRAEMERYVPKPVAKELAQQGSLPLSSSSISSSRSDKVPMVQFGSISFESSQNVSSTNASVGSVSLDVKEGDGRHSKHKKEHGHWRQRGTGPSPTHEPIKGTQHQTEQTQLVTSDITYSGNSEINAPVEATGRGRRRVPDKRTSRMEMDGNSVQLAAPDVDYNERNVDVRDHRGTGERTSHWKPKSHTYSTNNQHVDKPGGNETVITTEIINKLPKNVHSSQPKVQVHNKESSNTDNSLLDINVTEDSMSGNHQAFNREKKPFPAKGHSTFPNQDSVLPGESVPTGNTSGFWKHGGQSNRYVRGHEFYGDRPSGQDNRPHNVQRRHYEYQPVGPTKGGNLDTHDELTDGANNSGSQRFGERGQSHSKRGGNYYRRQGGAARVES